jgi:hypothetical protein
VAITIDDFTQGPVTLVDKLWGDGVANLSTGLSASHTAATARHVAFNVVDPYPWGDTGNVTVKLDTANGGLVKVMPDPGVTPVNFFISYGTRRLGLPAMSLNLTAGGADRLILDFGYAFPDPTNSAARFMMEVVLESSNAWSDNVSPVIPNSATPFSVEMPFSEIKARWPNLDLSNIINMQFGTSNGTMRGAFELRNIRTNSADRLPGDFNSDGAVNAADYVMWRNRYPSVYSQADLTNWRANFGGSGSVVGVGAGVPEPGCLGVWIAGVLGLWRGRRR